MNDELNCLTSTIIKLGVSSQTLKFSEQNFLTIKFLNISLEWEKECKEPATGGEI